MPIIMVERQTLMIVWCGALLMFPEISEELVILSDTTQSNNFTWRSIEYDIKTIPRGDKKNGNHANLFTRCSFYLTYKKYFGESGHYTHQTM